MRNDVMLFRETRSTANLTVKLSGIGQYHNMGIYFLFVYVFRHTLKQTYNIPKAMIRVLYRLQSS